MLARLPAKSATMALIDQLGDELAAKGPCTRSTIPLEPVNPHLTVFGKVREGETEQYLQWERERRAGLHQAPTEPCATPTADRIVGGFTPETYCRCGHPMASHKKEA